MLPQRLYRFVSSTALILLAVALLGPAAIAQNGHTLSAVGPANQAMGGAGVAHPTDAIGALHWNPALITQFSAPQLSIGIDIFVPSSEITSSMTVPTPNGPITLSGTTEARKRIFLIPSAGYVYKKPDSKIAYGIGINAIGAFGAEYREDPKNPVLMPQPFGFGRLKSEYQAVQFVPTVAYQVTKNLSVGVAPTITWHSLYIEPFLIGPRGDYAGTGVPIYRPGENEDSAMGVGVQAGVYYAADNGLELGFSYKSPMATKAMHYETPGPNNTVELNEFKIGYPAITSAGVGYRGPGRWGFAGDVRYIQYEGVDAFETLPLAPGGGIQGLGWRNIWAAAAGTSYRVNETLGLRMGYSWAQRAMPDDVALFNIATPQYVKHKLAGGIAYTLTEKSTFHFTYTHNFEGSIEGPRFGPGAPMSLGVVSSKGSGNGFLFGLTRNF
jgi:long-chain fatty acid transport protein